MDVSFLKLGFCRIPLKPTAYYDKVAYGDISPMLEDRQLLASIRISSRSLWQKLLKYKKGEIIAEKEKRKVELSLLRYASRCSNRSTLFGLSSSLRVCDLKVGGEYLKVQSNESERVLISSLESRVTFSLLAKMRNDKRLRQHLKLSRNTTLYRASRTRFKYYYWTDHSDRRSYELVEVKVDKPIEIIYKIAVEPLSFSSLYALVLKRIDEPLNSLPEREEFFNYFDSLVESGFLVLQIESIPFEPFPIESLLSMIRNLACPCELTEPYDSIITQVQKECTDYDCAELNDSGIEEMQAKLKQILACPVAEKDLLTFNSIDEATLSLEIPENIINELIEVKGLLNSINPSSGFSLFCQKYRECYGERPVQFIKLFDPAMGFMQRRINRNNIEGILEYVQPAGGSLDLKNIHLSSFEQLLLRNTIGIERSENGILDLAEFGLTSHNMNKLEVSAFSFEVINSKTIYLKNTSGSLFKDVSRFKSNNQSRINRAIQGLKDFEKKHQYAISLQLQSVTDYKMHNLRNLYQTEDEYYLTFGVGENRAKEQVLPISDIWIFVRGDVVRLYSKMMNEFVEPILDSNANLDEFGIGVFSFLAKMSRSNGKSDYSFAWTRNLQNILSYFPEVRYKNIILSPRTWKVDSVSYSDFKSKLNGKLESLEQFFNENGIPNKCFVAPAIASDKALYINARHPHSIQLFEKELKKHRSIFIVDSLNSTGKEDPDFQYRAEFSFVLESQEDSEKEQDYIPSEEFYIDRNDSDKWYSINLYCTEDSVDIVLLKLLRPIIDELKIKEWFFVRFNDGRFHLRFRFKMSMDTQQASGLMLANLIDTIEKAINSGMIFDYSINRYRQEIVRYTPECIDICEKIFIIDSKRYMALLGTPLPANKWLYAIAVLYDTVYSFFGNDQDVNQFLSAQMLHLSGSYHDLKAKNFQVDNVFREYSEVLLCLASKNQLYPAKSVEIENILVLQNKHPIGSLIDNIRSSNNVPSEILINEVLSSLVHMSMNRIFTQRTPDNEYSCYYLLSRALKSKQAILLYNS